MMPYFQKASEEVEEARGRSEIRGRSRTRREEVSTTASSESEGEAASEGQASEAPYEEEVSEGITELKRKAKTSGKNMKNRSEKKKQLKELKGEHEAENEGDEEDRSFMPKLGRAPEEPDQKSGAEERLSDIERPSMQKGDETRQDEPTIPFRHWLKHARFSDFEQPRPQHPKQAFGSTLGKLLGTDDGSSDSHTFNTTSHGQGRKPKPDQYETWAEKKRVYGTVGSFTRVKVDGVNELGRDPTGGWQKLSITVDSGAAESVIPTGCIDGWEVTAPPHPIFYQSATGETMANEGSQTLPFATNTGALRAMTFQNTNVTKPLASVKRITESGHAVIFLPEIIDGVQSMGSFIMNLKTGEIDKMREEDGNYVMDVWVPPPDRISENINEASFGRPR